jgi:hypothetical protein
MIEVRAPLPADTEEHAAAMAIAMQSLSRAGKHPLGFTVDHFA